MGAHVGLASHVDLAPTVLAAAGVTERPERMLGADLAPLFARPGAAPPAFTAFLAELARRRDEARSFYVPKQGAIPADAELLERMETLGYTH